MELVSGFTNPSRLRALNQAAMAECGSVDAAVAYVTDERTLIESCIKSSVKLALWARYDYSMPVSDAVIDRFLSKRSPDFSLRIVPDIFHPKVIWWHGFGAYIGSANLTQRAWSGGIEVGVFLEDEKLTEYGLDEGLTTFFQQVDDRSYPVTDEFLKHVRAIEASNAALYREEENARKLFDESRKALGISKVAGHTSDEAVEKAGKDGGWLLKRVIDDDKRTFETKKEALIRQYRWREEVPSDDQTAG